MMLTLSTGRQTEKIPLRKKCVDHSVDRNESRQRTAGGVLLGDAFVRIAPEGDVRRARRQHHGTCTACYALFLEG